MQNCLLYVYRPQRSWAKVMFLQASVILSTGGGAASVHAGMPAPPPRDQRPPLTRQTPPGPETHPPGPGRHPPWDQGPAPPPGPETPPREADASIRSMSGRYASYWNAFLFIYLYIFQAYQNKVALQRQQELGGHGLQLHDFNAQSPRNHQSPRSPLGSSPLGSSPLGSPQKSHKCQHCYKAFPSTQQLGQHSLVHSNVRKYACLYCDKTFKQLSHLQQHHRRHTGA